MKAMEWTAAEDDVLRRAMARGCGPYRAARALADELGASVSPDTVEKRMSEIALPGPKAPREHGSGRLGYCAWCGRLRVLRDLRCLECSRDGAVR